MSLVLTDTAQQLGFRPNVPETLEDLHVPRATIIDLVARHVFREGTSSYALISRSLKLSIPVVDNVVRQLRSQQLLEVRGMIGEDYSLALTIAGKAFAAERTQFLQYVGPAPVSINDYIRATREQAAQVNVNRETLRNVFADLVMSNKTLDQLGPALISQKSLFLYGPPGNGKTSIAERLLRAYHDYILIPYAVAVDSQIITLFDPVVHQPVGATSDDIDSRWIACKRPCITVGGELVMGMLDLRSDQATGIYTAPLQMKANNGIFLIDDFGRQRISPEELLNRWIVPLDRRVDYLTLGYGTKFQIPFEMMVVFSTNLDPKQLADEAFLRRIENKVFVEPVEAEIFDEIFRRVVEAKRLPCEPDASEFLRGWCVAHGAELRACYPADLCKIITAISKYQGRPTNIDRDNLERAANLYFTH
jgi:predicted ATPase with chaperone activity